MIFAILTASTHVDLVRIFAGLCERAANFIHVRVAVIVIRASCTISM